MNPFKIPDFVMDEMTQLFTIERNKTIISNVHGFFCGNDYPSTIQLVENTDIKNGDWLIDSITKQRYFADDVRPIIVDGEPSDWLVKYVPEHTYNKLYTNNSSTTINIQSINGNSAIGNQEHVIFNIGFTSSDIENLIQKLPIEDHPQATELLGELKRTESSNHPILVEGALSKFSNLLKKHTDLLTAVGGWAVQLLIGK